MWDFTAESYNKNGKRDLFIFWAPDANTEESQNGHVSSYNSLDPAMCLHLLLTMALNNNFFVLHNTYKSSDR